MDICSGHSSRNAGREITVRDQADTRTGRTNIVNLATTLHPDAIACRLEKQGGWRTRRYPAIVRWPERMDLWEQWEDIYANAENADREPQAAAFHAEHKADLEAGALIQWPARYPLLSLMQARSLGHAAFESEMQCNPIDPETCEFEPAYFEGVTVEDMPDDLDIRVIAITSAVAAAAGAVASAAIAGLIAYWSEKRAEKKAADAATDTAIQAAELTVQDMLSPSSTPPATSDR